MTDIRIGSCLLYVKLRFRNVGDVGDIINILGQFDPISSSCEPPSIKSTISIDSKSHFLIHHPDNLISVTAIANAIQCRRKPLLGSLVRSSSSEVTPSLLWGNMLHEVVQTCLSSERWEESWIHECINDVIMTGLEELVRIGIGIEEARKELKLRAKGLRTFSEKYIGHTPKVDIFSDLKCCSNSSASPSRLVYSLIRDQGVTKMHSWPSPSCTTSKRTFGLLLMVSKGS
jgi:DNA replication factor Dna2